MLHSEKPKATRKNDMNRENKKIPQQRKTELAEPNDLLKEYELCWQGVEHHNTRLWTSASIFISGSILALTWIGTMPLGVHDWEKFSLVAILASAISLVMYSYLKIFSHWELLDCVELYRAQEIEHYLKLWRIRYRLHESAKQTSSEQESTRLNTMSENIAKRLAIPIKDLSKRHANPFFRLIIYTIIFCPDFFGSEGITGYPWLVELRLRVQHYVHVFLL